MLAGDAVLEAALEGDAVLEEEALKETVCQGGRSAPLAGGMSGKAFSLGF